MSVSSWLSNLDIVLVC